MRRALATTILGLFLLAGSVSGLARADVADPEFDPAAEALALANDVANAAGQGAWAKVKHVRFTWTHLAKNVSRSYDWDREKGTVAVTMNGQTIVVPEKGAPADPNWNDEKKAAHAAFINDWYWFSFELRAAADTGRTLEDLGFVDVPGFPKMGKKRGLRVHYTGPNGYTPGDAYVLYLNDDHTVAAWSYYPGAAAEPRMTVTREARGNFGGLRLPTRFVGPDGKTVIEISNIQME